jgi:UDP-GlcNAc3NAcA epimerase
VLTDSGGVQKEAFFFKKPCITLREATEWVELVESGWNTLAGADSGSIIQAVKNAAVPAEYPALYGDGKCAEKITGELQK